MQVKCKANTKYNSYAKQIHFIYKINAIYLQNNCKTKANI